MKILISIGTRPELIKLYPLVIELKKYKKIKTIICFTGQHDTLIKKILKDFKLKPNYRLNCKNDSGNLNILTSKLYFELDKILKKEKPDLVIVQGDTSSALVSSVAAFHNKIKIAHVEAGLRSNHLKEPFPEEFNRLVISKIANLNFAPTKNAVNNLLNENIDKKTIYLTGNTVVDALNIFKKKKCFKKIKKTFILVTCHRRENYSYYQNLIKNIKLAASKVKDIQIRILCHPGILNFRNNKKKIQELSKSSNIKIYQSLTYFEILNLIANCKFIITDSGGIQEEAPSFKKFVYVIRNYTERVEGSKKGISKLISIKNNQVYREIIKNYKKKGLFDKKKFNPYGNGKAAKFISKILKKI